MELLINMFWDEEAKVWCAINDEVGIAFESETYDELVKRVVIAAPEMAKLNHVKFDGICFKSEFRMPVSA